MKQIQILILLFITQSLISQDIIKGKIVDFETYETEGIPYVNIGIIGKSIGTVSNLEGDFELTIDSKYDQDTLRISMIGYQSQEFIVADFKEKLSVNSNVVLFQQSTNLQEVIVSSKEFKNTKIRGNTTESKTMTGAFSTDKLGCEMGIIVKVKKRRPTFVKDFNTSIAKNTYGTIKFRLNFYSVKKGKPHETILTENIIVTTDIESGVLKVDLTEYNIIVEEDFYVGLEWIEDLGKDGLKFSFRMMGSPLLTRDTSQDRWQKIGAVGPGMYVTVAY